MKLKIHLIYFLFLTALVSLYAEAPESTANEKKELPEVSNPPYSIGDRATIQGYYVALGDDVSLNMRILNNRLHVYWVDADDLILEPRASNGSLRFLDNARGPNYFGVATLNNEDGVGSIGGPIFKPHIFTLILSLEKDNGEGFDSYTFRYTPAMADTRKTRTFVESDTKDD